MQQFRRKTGDRLTLVLATGLGVGLCPVLPGTVGSLWGLPLAWGLQQSGLPPAAQLLPVAVLFFIGIPLCRRAAELLGREDPPSVVYDELVAVPLVFLVAPLDLTSGVAGFLWFRLFDIVKPWPVSRFDNMKGGLGIMADDVAAAVYAAGCLWLTVQGLELLSAA